MFYLIIAILILSYYFFMAPKSVRNTLSMIGLVAMVAFLIVLAGMSVLKILQSPPEVFIVLAMIALAYFSFKDILNLPKK